MLKFIKNKKNVDVVVSHRHATVANALIKTWAATTTLSIFKRRSCSAKYIVIDCINVILRSKTIFLTVGNAALRFLRIWNQDRRAMYESSLCKFTGLNTNYILRFCLFVEFNIVCYVALVFSFFLFLTTSLLELFYEFLETRRFQWAHWQIIASSCDFHSSDELAHMQYRKGLHQQYRHKVETHPVSNIGPLSAQFYIPSVMIKIWSNQYHENEKKPTQAPSPTSRWLRNHVWRIPLRIPKLCGFGRMSTRGLYM